MKKVLSRLTLAILVALVAALAFAVPALADPVTTTAGTPGNNATWLLEKRVQTAVGVTPPATTFTFNIAQVTTTLNDQITTTAVTPNTTWSTTILVDPATATHTVAGGVNTWTAVSLADIFAGVTFPAPGVYQFRILESATPSPAATAPAAWDMDSVVARYVEVRVANDPREGHEGELYIRSITGLTAGATANNPVAPKTYTVWTNTYTDTNDLEISKVVTGDLANQSLLFNFTLTLTDNAIANTIQTLSFPIEGTIRDASGAVVVDAARNPVEITGTTATFQLRHGETLTIPGLPAGVGFVVVETGVAGWTPSGNIELGGAVTAIPAGAEGANFTIGATPAGIVHDTGRNAADFSNAYREITDTGLVIASMPFMAALIAATVLLAMMVASRSRHRIEQLPIAY